MPPLQLKGYASRRSVEALSEDDSLRSRWAKLHYMHASYDTWAAGELASTSSSCSGGGAPAVPTFEQLLQWLIGMVVATLPGINHLLPGPAAQLAGLNQHLGCLKPKDEAMKAYGLSKESDPKGGRKINWARSQKARGYVLLQLGCDVARKTVNVRMHALLCWLVHGSPQKGQVAMHTCNMKWCINPHHLKWGSKKANWKRKPLPKNR
jgi:hypothetical protein